MKLMKLGLRFWITLTSVFSFMVGWAMLAHAPKPVQYSSSASQNSVTPLPTLAPLNFSNTNNGGVQVQQFNVQQQPNIFQQAPVFTTGGT